MGRICFLSIGIFIIFLFAAFEAKAFDITFPVVCNYGKDCFIRGYYDHGEKELVEDYTCGGLSVDNQKSTEIMLKSYKQMKYGVDVLSAEKGTVEAIRDGMDDVGSTLLGRASIKGRECGNGIIIEHKRGFKTQYCHLKKNSIIVKPGDVVEKGQRIAQVGLSGDSDFPHLEFSTMRKDFTFDPFMGDEVLPCGSKKSYPYWDKESKKKLKYIPTALLNLGFYNKVPHREGARSGKFHRKTIENDSDIIAFWVDIFGIQKGDELKLEILGPDGIVIEEETRKFREDKRQHYQFVGKKQKDEEFWQQGRYTGKVVVVRRGDKVVDAKAFVLVQEPQEEEN